MGYHLGETEEELRSDILLLLKTLSSNTKIKESQLIMPSREYNKIEFPLEAHISIIKDFYKYGYYTETKIRHIKSKRGKIDWNKTIKTQKKYVQDSDFFYLDFITRQNKSNENELVTLIHKYCVYISFKVIGWLFSTYLPQKSEIRYNKALFETVIKNKYTSTFDDREKNLFKNMLSIINHEGNPNAPVNYEYGTSRFEYIWEKMIDRAFGLDDKKDFFPGTYWIIDEKRSKNYSLEPDTIMINENNIYVLDAKYYKYGLTNSIRDLPESTSINKQITYAEYIATNQKFKEEYKDFKIYNGFIMPFDSEKFTIEENIINIGKAYSSWKTNEKEYEEIQGILLDMKYIMKNNVKRDIEKIKKLSSLFD